MANTYELIASNALSSNTASFTFSSIPATYTDLVLRASVRFNFNTTGSQFFIKPNSDTGTNYSDTLILGTGSVASTSSTAANSNGLTIRYISAGSDTASTFSSSEVYIPNYASTGTKQISSFSVEENNGAAANMATTAHLYAGTSAITSLLISVATQTMLSGSSFYLYGIKKN